MGKTLDHHFLDWEGDAFGYGYGTGEAHTIPALLSFFEGVPENRPYDYNHLEAKLTPTVAWLLINTLCKCGVIEYGCSPRFGWLTGKGKALRSYLSGKDADFLYGLTALNTEDDNYIPCYPDACNCHDDRSDCGNPFWGQSTPSTKEGRKDAP